MIETIVIGMWLLLSLRRRDRCAPACDMIRHHEQLHPVGACLVDEKRPEVISVDLGLGEGGTNTDRPWPLATPVGVVEIFAGSAMSADKIAR